MVYNLVEIQYVIIIESSKRLYKRALFALSGIWEGKKTAFPQVSKLKNGIFLGFGDLDAL